MRRVLQCKGQCIETRRGKCREMHWECAQEAPALGTTFHSLALEGAGEFFVIVVFPFSRNFEFALVPINSLYSLLSRIMW